MCLLLVSPRSCLSADKTASTAQGLGKALALVEHLTEGLYKQLVLLIEIGSLWGSLKAAQYDPKPKIDVGDLYSSIKED